MKILTMLLLLLQLFGCSNNQKKDEVKENNQDKKVLYLAHDIRLFENSKAWNLANAVKNEDTNRIIKLCRADTSLINYQETQNGQTILCWAVKVNCYVSARTLLELGANPNLQNDNGISAFIEAAIKPNTEIYVSLLLKYGGDVNAIAKVKDGDNQHFRTPLICAARHNLESVKLLILNGADVNYTNEFDQSALRSACNFKRIDIVKYLIENGADFKRPLYNINGAKYLVDELRQMNFELKSKEYKIKMEVVAILLKNGIDYRKSPIPKENLESLPKEYLDVY